jgi:O-antigen/teichoic acid export membrane protein
MRANNRFAMITSVEVLYGLALLLGHLYLVSTDATWEAFLYWNIVASAIRGSLLLTYFLFCFAKLNLRFIVSSQTIAYVKDFASGMKLMFTSTATFVVKTTHMQLDTILLGHLFGPAASGAYKLARSFTQLLAFPTNALFQVSFPEFVQLLYKKQADKFKRVVKKLILVTLAVSLVYWLGSVFIVPLLIPLLLGDSYGVTAELLPILVFGLSITMLSQYWHSALVAVNNAGQVAISMLIALVGQISMLLIVAPILGIKAAAVAFVFYSLIRALLLFSKFKKFVLNKI